MRGLAFLSAEWVAAHVEAASTLPTRPDASAFVVHEVTGAPGGTVRYGVAWVDGRIVEASLDPEPPEPHLVVIEPIAITRALASGDIDPALAFMRGETKVVGDMGTFLRLAPLFQHDDHAEFVARLHERTTFD